MTTTTATVDDVKDVLRDAGRALRHDLWAASDEEFLAAKARDLVRLARKAAATEDPHTRIAYLAAARDTINHVKLVALMRMEVAASHVLDTLGRLFLERALPALIERLPSLLGIS